MNREKTHTSDNNVVSLDSFRSKRKFDDEVGRGRTPLHVSHLDGKIKGSPHLKRPDAEDFGNRMQRIKMSLEKINKLMSDLKNKSRED